MKIWVNNQSVELTSQPSLHAVIGLFGAQGSFAVALNGCFVSRSEYETTTVNDGDRIEILSPIEGG